MFQGSAKRPRVNVEGPPPMESDYGALYGSESEPALLRESSEDEHDMLHIEERLNAPQADADDFAAYVEFDRAECDEDPEELLPQASATAESHRAGGPSDLSRGPGAAAVVCKQPVRGYPIQQVQGKNRSFRPEWKLTDNAQFDWLEYSSLTDKMYCHRCRHFGTGRFKTWEVEGTRCKNWKDALSEIKKHHNHAAHKSCEVALVDWKTSLQTGGIRTVMDKVSVKLAMDNSHYVRSVAEVINFCARQGVALRGHREGDSASNKGNVLELMELVSKHDSVVLDKLRSGRKYYTSATIQNELLEIQASLIRQDVAQEICDAGYYSVLADESRDAGKHEQIAITCRYFIKGSVQDSFLGFSRAASLTAASLSADILQALESAHIPLSGMVAQSFDGASTMSGLISGVQRRISEATNGKALFVHCSAHRLNLATVGAIKRVGKAQDVFHHLSSLYSFLSSSVVHAMYEEKRAGINRLEMQRLSDTRWVCQHAACHSTRANLPIIVDTLSHFAESNDPTDVSRGTDSRGLLQVIDTMFVIELCILEEVLYQLRALHLALQKETLDLPAANLMVDSTIDYCRSELAAFTGAGAGVGGTGWRKVYQRFMNLREELDLPAPVRRPVRRARRDAAADRVEVLYTESDYLRVLYRPIVEAVMQELERRFKGENALAFKGIDSLSPASPNFLLMDRGLSEFADHYGVDKEALVHEIRSYHMLISNKTREDEEFTPPSCITELLVLIEPYRMVTASLYGLAQIAVTIPVGTASCERSFSSMRRIKTWLRTVMTDDRLDWLAMLCVHRQRAKALAADDFGRVVQVFKERCNRKMNIV